MLKKPNVYQHSKPKQQPLYRKLKGAEQVRTKQYASAGNIREFIDAYEDKKQLKLN